MSGKQSVHRARVQVSVIVLVLAVVIGVLAAVAGASGAAALPPPVLGQLVDLVPVSGKVFVTVPGQKRTLLSAGRQVRVGSIVDASQGTVQLTAADSNGKQPYSGQFSQGGFRVLQSVSGGGTTQVVLVGACTKSHAAIDGRRATIAKKHGPHVRRFLQITANGKFDIVGANAHTIETGPAAWEVDDNCDGTTSIVDHEGTVQEATRLGRFAPLAPGNSVAGFCQPPKGPTHYCEGVLSVPDVNQGGFELIILHQRETEFTLCLLSKGRTVRCQIGKFKPNASGSEATNLSCTFDTLPRGTYQARFLLRGTQLGMLLPFTTHHLSDPGGPPISKCVSFIE